MNKVVLANTQSDGAAWDNFVRAAPDATFCHLFSWKAVFSETYGHHSYYLAAISDSGEWQGVLPLVQVKSHLFGNALFSLPFVNYGGLICRNNAAGEMLLNAATELCSALGASYVELRHAEQIWPGLHTRHHKVSMVLKMASEVDAQWRAFDTKLRNQIRKAEKSGLGSAEGHLDLLDGFYEVLARNMRDLGSPIHAKSFFRRILEEFPQNTRVLVVSIDGKIIAAGLVCWFGETIEIPWASSLREYNSLCPNNLLYWNAIRLAIGRGIRTFDFGRSTPNEGTFNFKKQWGAVPMQLNWQYAYGANQIAPGAGSQGRMFQVAAAIWRKLPVAVTKVIGPGIRKYISL